MEKGGFVYILGSKGLRLYTGVTTNLEQRISQHNTKSISGFTARYNIDRLLYFETFGEIEPAIAREKQIKRWRRDKKLALIRSANPEFRDLSEDWYRVEEGG